MQVITNYWSKETFDCSEILRESCEKLSIAFDREQVTALDGCTSRVQRKPYYILGKLASMGKDLLWLDSWSKILSQPKLLEGGDYDVAAFKCGDLYWSGTIFARKTDRMMDLCHAWMIENTKNPTHGHQNFTRAVVDLKPKLLVLPQTYCWLAGTFEKLWPKDVPVIEQRPI